MNGFSSRSLIAGFLTLVCVLSVLLIAGRRTHDDHVAEQQGPTGKQTERRVEPKPRGGISLFENKGEDESAKLRSALSRLQAQKVQLDNLLEQYQALVQDRDRLAQQVEALRRQGLEPTNAEAPLDKLGRPSVEQATAAPKASEGDDLDTFICVAHLDQIAIAVDAWALDHNDHAPQDLLALRDYLSPMILVCPSATPKSFATLWQKFDPATVTYVVRNPGMEWQRGITKTFAECPIHHTYNHNRPSSVGGYGRARAGVPIR